MNPNGEIKVRRSRLVVVGVGSIKCDYREALRVAEGADPERVYVERSTVWLMPDGTEVLGPWQRDNFGEDPHVGCIMR